MLSPDYVGNLIEDSKVIYTVSSLTALQKIDTKTKVIVEILTPLNRHGIEISELNRALAIVNDRGLALRGFTLHLPIANIESKWLQSTLEMLPQGSNVWISHLYKADRVKKHFPSLIFRERIGTSLWLGAESALEVTATVLERKGYTMEEIGEILKSIC